MKTAISIPDSIFHSAEALADRLQMSRSELYSSAVREYVESHRHDNVTEALNEVYANESSEMDPVLAQMQWLTLDGEIW